MLGNLQLIIIQFTQHRLLLLRKIKNKTHQKELTYSKSVGTLPVI